MFPHAGRVLYSMHSIEFQRRGLPHCHLLLKFERSCVVPADIDQVISAELPTDPADRALVEQFMCHRHSTTPSRNTYCIREDGSCRFNYPYPINPETFITSSGRVRYRRRSA